MHANGAAGVRTDLSTSSKSASGATPKGQAPRQIVLSGKLSLPKGFAPSDARATRALRSIDEDSSDGDSDAASGAGGGDDADEAGAGTEDISVVSAITSRRRGETSEERKLRKAAVGAEISFLSIS